jgi:hypothetical protein
MPEHNLRCLAMSLPVLACDPARTGGCDRPGVQNLNHRLGDTVARAFAVVDAPNQAAPLLAARGGNRDAEGCDRADISQPCSTHRSAQRLWMLRSRERAERAAVSSFIELGGERSVPVASAAAVMVTVKTIATALFLS